MNKGYSLIALVTIAILFLLVSACDQPQNSSGQLQVTWTLDSISVDPAKTFVTLEIDNQTVETLSKDNFLIAYNHLVGQIEYKSEGPGLVMKTVGGDYIQIIPTKDFTSIAPGTKSTYSFAIAGHLDKRSELPVGVFAVIDGSPREVLFTTSGMNEKVLAPIGPTTAATRYEQNERLSLLDRSDLLPFIPAPTTYDYLDETKTLGKIISLSHSEGLETEIEQLKDGLKELGITTTPGSGDADLTVAIQKLDDEVPDTYRLRIDNSGIAILASKPSGIFYGIQSLLQYIGDHRLATSDSELKLKGIEVLDQPRFDYRGMHLDVSRNFHRAEAVKSLIDQMAAHKLNHLQMHVTDDEGWRLEIPGLPELTEIGSKRGYTTDESAHLIPSYGSGSDVDKSYGSGFYSRETYIDLLRYAKDRHIKVITEIDLPAHARAAIISMRARYQRLMDAGDEAGAIQYRLDDPEDQSTYRSAQNWTDNVICICQESSYDFTEKVIAELVSMYDEAGAELDAIHIGGDELPYGAWQKSPICEKFSAEQPSLSSTDDLPGYFFNRIKKIIDKYGIIAAGWEDMVLEHNKDAHESTVINSDFKGTGVRPYVWNAIMGGGREDMIYKLANAGFDVVMSNSSSFYFDMAYDRDPDEIGLSWSGFADTEKGFRTEPLDIFHGTPRDESGNLLDKEYVSKMERLTKEGEQHFLGIQAQLWSETIRDAQSIEYLTYPKIAGFAQRAWSPAGKWTYETDPDIIKSVYEKEWNIFANTIGQKVLPRFDQVGDGLKYRIPEPGVTVVNDQVTANTTFPGLQIYYQVGLDDPPKEYTGPIKKENGNSLKFWSTSSTGRKGREVIIE